MSRAGRLLRQLGALTSLAGILVGLPLLLDALLEPPRLQGLPGLVWLEEGIRYRYFRPEPILRLITLTAWVLWAYAAVVTILRVLAALALRLRLAAAGELMSASTLVTVRPLRWVADAAIGAALLATTTLTAPRSTTPPDPHPVVATMQPITPAAVPSSAAAVSVNGSAAGLLRLDRQTELEQAATEPVTITTHADPATGQPLYEITQGELRWRFTTTRPHKVEPGESLWRIAERELPNPYWWRVIWHLNQGRTLVDYAGNQTVFDNPGFTRPGWEPEVPEDIRRYQPDQAAPVPDREKTAPPSTTQPPDQPSPTSPTPPPLVEEREPDGPAAVQLPTGGVIAGSVALAVLVALAIARRRRQRQRRPQPPVPGIRHVDPDDVPIRRRLHDAFDPTEVSEFTDQTIRQPPRVSNTHSQANGPVADSPAGQTLSDHIDQQISTPPETPHPIAIGHRNGAEVTLDLEQLGALALVGPAADDVARAMAVALLASHPPPLAEVLATDDLLPTLECAGLVQLPDFAAGLRQLELASVSRTRLLDTTDHSTAAAFRAHDPIEPLPTVMLLARLDPQHTRWVQALAERGQRHGLVMLLVAADPDSAATLPAWVSVDDDGVPQAHGGTLPELSGVRLARISLAEADELLAPIVASRRTDTPDLTPSSPPSEPEEEESFQSPPSGGDQAPVMVYLFGTIRIEVAGREVLTRLGDLAPKLLGYLLLHPEGATTGAVAERLWPEEELAPEQESRRFRNTLYTLRKPIRAATGREELEIIQRPAENLLRLESGVVDCDLWHFQAALADADQAPDDTARAAALAHAVDLYTGPLAQGAWSWSAPEQQSLHGKTLDALKALASLREAAGEIDGAVAALHRAIDLAPESEGNYQQLMQLHADQGDLDAVNRVYHQLETAMRELGVAPSPDSTTMVASLREGLSRKARAQNAARRRGQPPPTATPTGHKDQDKRDQEPP